MHDEEGRTERKAGKVLKLVALVTMLPGLVLLMVCVLTYQSARSFVDEAQNTTGTVVDLSERSDSDGDTMYYPVFVFRDAKGEEHRIHSSVGSSPPAHQEGEEVTVLYLPDDPTEAKIEGFFSLWLWPVVTGVLAFFFLAFPVGLFIAGVFFGRLA
jgi:hypothetical protein